MSNAHKGSRLLLSGNIIPVDFSTAHINFSNDATGIQYGNFVQQSSNSIYTLRQYEGKFGGGIAIEEGTTNLISNPMFDSNISGWAVGNLATPSWNNGFNDIKINNGYMYVTGSSGNGFIQGPVYHGLISGSTYTVSAYVEGDGMDIYNKVTVGGTVFYSGSGVYDDYTWSTSSHRFTKINDRGIYRVDITFALNQGSHSGNALDYFQPRVGLNASNLNLKVYGYQLENKAFSTSLVNGTRANGRVTYTSNIVNKAQGTASCWVNSETSGGGWRRIIAFVGANSVNGITDLNFDIEPNNIIRLKADPSYSVASTGNIGQPNTWYHIACSWGSSGLKVYINGNLDSTNASFTSGITALDSTLSIGARQTDSADFVNGIISDFAIYQTQLSDEDIKAIFISNRPLYNPYDYRAIAY